MNLKKLSSALIALALGLGNSFSATLTVTTLADSGPGSLRQMIADAVSGDTIDFDFTVTGTISLTNGPLNVDKPVTISGPGATNLLILGAGDSSGPVRVFNVSAGPTTISALTLTGGNQYYDDTARESMIRNTAYLTLSACSLIGGRAYGKGGAVFNIGVSATLIATDCTFADNSSIYSSGALWNDNVLRVTNCTFSGNSSYFGDGGAVWSSGDAVIASSTITRNETRFSFGGGVFNAGGTLTLQNTILAGNTSDYFGTHDVGGDITGGDYNLIQDTNNVVVPGTHNVLGVDPQLSGLRYLGGNTRTHGLAGTSPALDAADVGTSPPTDQRGAARPQGAGYDIGAFEGALPLNHPPVVANVIPNQGGVYLGTFSYTLPANTFSDPDADQSLTYSASGLPNYFSFDPVTGLFSGPIYTAGTFTVTVTATDDGAPQLSTSTTFDIVIPKSPLTARADDQTRHYGDPDPFFSISYFGVLPDDFGFFVNDPPAATTTATVTSPPGAYSIVLSGGSDDVYEFVGLTNGTLTVTPAPLFVIVDSVLRRVGLTNPPLTATISGIRNSDNITVTLTTAATPASPLGEYPITVALNDPDGKLSNYTVTTIPGSLSVVDFDVNYQVLRPFGFTNQMSRFPSSRLIEAGNEWLYGATPVGGVADAGGVYRVRLDGTEFTVLHHFTGTVTGTNDDGRRGWGGVTLASDGVLYGATTRGGYTNNGTIYKLNLDGTGYAVLRRFGQTDGDATVPTSPLIEGTDGALYGTTYYGGASNVGTVFKMNKDGSGYAILHSFDGTDGDFPEAGVIEGQDGMLYGTTVDGADGDLLSGSVFKLSKDGTFFAVIASSGASRAPLVQGRSDGFLYGVTDSGGTLGQGAIFKLDTNGTSFVVLHDFGSISGDGGFIPGYAPAVGSLIEGTNGDLFGVTQLGGSFAGTVFAIGTDGNNYRVLRPFVNGSFSTDGVEPTAGLLQAHDGVLYGTAHSGGTAYDGTLFKINDDGTGYATVWNFNDAGGDIVNPEIPMVEGNNGALYGASGGAIFRMKKDGTGYEFIYRANLTDGIAYPQGLVAGSDGALYGLARGGLVNIGGVFTSFPDRFFRVNLDGTGYTNLHTFSYLEGTFDFGSSLIEGSNGVFYGTVETGGDSFSGTLFRVNSDGSEFSVLQSFLSTTGSTPSQVLEGSDGRLYGILNYGGEFNGGALFAINTNGIGYTNLHVFSGTSGDGFYPVACLLEGSDGRLYGATSSGGVFGSGTLFVINKDGSGYSILRSLGASPSDARAPSGLVEGSDGYLYGTSLDGGNSDSGSVDPGTVFRLRKDGSGYVVLHRFYVSPDDGYDPIRGIHLSSDGAFYGVTTYGGFASGFSTLGTIYRLSFDHVSPNLPPTLDHPIADQNGVYGVVFNYPFPADTFSDPDAGQVLAYSVTGLPPGISFDGPTRTLSGTPTAAGTFNVELTATDDGAPPASVSDFFNIVVASAPLVVTSDNKTRLVGQPNPPLTGTLAGVTNGDNITVTFTTAAVTGSPPGSYAITPVFSDLDNRLPNYAITTNAGVLAVVACPTITLLPTVLPAAPRSVAYSQTLTASGGSLPYQFAVTSGTLPAGLFLSSAGLLSGTPTFAGSFPFTVTATDASGCTGARSYTLTVTCPALTLSPSALPGGTRGVTYSQTITASGGTAPYTFAVTGGVLPTGVSLAGNGLLAGALTTARFSHTATLLANGKVLVAGGQAIGGFANSSEIYDPATGTWAITGPLAAGRAVHTATLLPNGKVLVTGGQINGGVTNSAELFDPATGTWTVTAAMSSRRFGHTATLLPNGKVLVAGGNAGSGSVSTTELYDPATGTWTATGTLNFARDSHTATLLANGKVLVARGSAGNSAELYDSTTGIWTLTGSLTSGGPYHTATLLSNGNVLVAGGFGPPFAEIYDPLLGTWTMTGNMIEARGNHTATLLANGRVLVAGGSGINFMGQPTIVSSAELYDPATGTWASTASLGPRASHTATLLQNGKVLVTAGQTAPFGGGTTNSSALYDPAPGTWSATGVPGSAGSFSFTVTATDANGCTGSRSLSLSIACSAFTIIPGTLPQAVLGSSYNQALIGSGGESIYNFAVTAGALPAGVTLAVSGVIAGTPTASGTFSFTVTATDGGHCTSSTNLSLVVNAASPMMTTRGYHTSTLLPNGKLLVVGGCCGGSGGAEAEVYDPAVGTWTVTGSLNAARDSHTATLLPNGKVLVVGGNNALSSAELYDPATGTWSLTGTLNTPRYRHTATLLSNGKVLVAAGANFNAGGNYISSAELYDPATGTWTETGPLNGARTLQTATLLSNGKVLVAGGYGGSSSPISSAEIYDPVTGTWTTTGSMSSARFGHTSTLLPNGKVLVAAGYNGSYLSASELYDPATGTWTPTGALTTPRQDSRTTLLPNGKVLIAGGVNSDINGSVYLASTELYNPATGTWTASTTLNTARFNHTVTLLSNGRVLIAGGYNYPAGYLASVELYDSAVASWAATGGLTTGRSSHTATLLPNGKVLAAGGYNATSDALSVAQLFDQAAGTWTATGPLATARYGQTANLLPDGKVLVAGGAGAGVGVYLAGTELYDPASGTWAASDPLGAPRWLHTATLLANGKVLVTGGQNSGGAANGAELYDVGSGTWTATGPLNGARWNHTAILLPGGKVMVAGGTADGTTPLASAELYDPATGVWTAIASLNVARKAHTATLLPNGKVLLAGGFGVSLALATTELYDPGAGTWTPSGKLAAVRQAHTATLLPNGKVLAAGGAGSTGVPLLSAELYDPATGIWGTTSGLSTPRVSYTATLLPNGKVLVAAGLGTSSTYLSTAALYDVGLGFIPASQPQITTATSPLASGGSLALTGSRFRGISEGSVGNSQDSPSDYPVVQLRSLGNGQTLSLLVSNWSTNSFTSTPISGFPLGYALVTMFVNGIPGVSVVVSVSPAFQNHPPIVANPIADSSGTYGDVFSLTFPANTFSDPDAGQILSYAASGLPPGLLFTSASRTFTGTPSSVGAYPITVTATDNGAPPLNVPHSFNIIVGKAALTITPAHTNRPYYSPNPTLTGVVLGLVLGDDITAIYNTTATLSSPPGDYPITFVLADSGGKLGNYLVTTNVAALTVDGVPLQITTTGGSSAFCWPTNAVNFVLECTTDLTPPVTWGLVTNTISVVGTNKCLILSTEPNVPERFYRLHLQ